MSYYAKRGKNKLNFYILAQHFAICCLKPADFSFEKYNSYEENINSPETLTREFGSALLTYSICPYQTLPEHMGAPKYYLRKE